MTTYFFNDTSTWGSDGIPQPLSDFTFPENKIISIRAAAGIGRLHGEPYQCWRFTGK